MFTHLVADKPHPSLGSHAETYGRLIGSWRGTYRDVLDSGEEIGPLEVHFAWVLEGRAVQDIWIAPRAFAVGIANLRRQMHGTTIRVFDPESAVWRVDWWNPCRGVHNSLVGRRVNDGIVQTGYWDGCPQRWRFQDILPDSFTWQAHRLSDGAERWELQTEFLLERMR